MKKEDVKKLVYKGYLSCFIFVVSLFAFYFTTPRRSCSGDINSICGIIKTETFFGYITLFIFIIILLIIFKLIFIRFKCRKEKDFIKEIHIGKSLIDIILIVIIVSFLVSILIISPTGSRCKAIQAMKKSEISNLRFFQEKYYDANNRYANNFNELELSKEDIKRFEDHDIQMRRTENPNSWYADVKFYSTEFRYPCVNKISEEIYFCDENECRFK